jgi:hypothetical protein
MKPARQKHKTLSKKEKQKNWGMFQVVEHKSKSLSSITIPPTPLKTNKKTLMVLK